MARRLPGGHEGMRWLSRPRSPATRKALLALGVAVILGLSVAGVARLLLGFEPARRLTEAMRLVSAGMSAPGAAEVSKVPGCHAATVVDARRLHALEADFRKAFPELDALPPLAVLCRVRSEATPPSCERVAQAFRRGAAPADVERGFVVAVSIQLEEGYACAQAHRASSVEVPAPGSR